MLSDYAFHAFSLGLFQVSEPGGMSVGQIGVTIGVEQGEFPYQFGCCAGYLHGNHAAHGKTDDGCTVFTANHFNRLVSHLGNAVFQCELHGINPPCHFCKCINLRFENGTCTKCARNKKYRQLAQNIRISYARMNPVSGNRKALAFQGVNLDSQFVP